MYIDRTYYLAPDGGVAANAFAVMYTLHHAAEIRDIEQVEGLNSVPLKVKASEVKLAKQVVATFEAELDLKTYRDEYRDGLRAIIDAKIAGEEIVSPDVEEPQKVVDLMDALRRSLDRVSTEKKKPAKAKLPAARKTKAKASKTARARKAG
jgi:DNA end-binding protein Ku